MTGARTAARREAQRSIDRTDAQLAQLAARLDVATASFISDHAARLEAHAAEQARIEADLARLVEYRDLILRHSDTERTRAALEQRRAEIQEAIAAHEFGQADAEHNIRALENRLSEYLEQLHIPGIGELVTINRKTYLPEISARRFEELSSQGLKRWSTSPTPSLTTPWRSTGRCRCPGCWSSTAFRRPVVAAARS